MIRRTLLALLVAVTAVLAAPAVASAQDDDGYQPLPTAGTAISVGADADVPPAAGVAAEGATLPRTGNDVAAPVAIAGVAIALGAAFVLLAGRRRRDPVAA